LYQNFKKKRKVEKRGGVGGFSQADSKNNASQGAPSIGSGKKKKSAKEQGRSRPKFVNSVWEGGKYSGGA